VQMIYQPYFADPRPENMPVLGDLLNALMAQGIPEAERVAQALDLYVNGSLVPPWISETALSASISRVSARI